MYGVNLSRSAWHRSSHAASASAAFTFAVAATAFSSSDSLYAVVVPFSPVQPQIDDEGHVRCFRYPKPNWTGFPLMAWFFEAACELAGMERFFLLIHDRPEVAHAILERVCGFMERTSEIMFEKAGRSSTSVSLATTTGSRPGR
jgi:hypothetical protein